MSNTISNTDNVIDSRDLVEYIERISAQVADRSCERASTASEESRAELEHLVAFAAKFEKHAADYKYGDTAIHESYFVEHIRELIADCYEVKESGEWPYRHMKLDFEAAADEAKQDYTHIDFNGETYLVRG